MKKTVNLKQDEETKRKIDYYLLARKQAKKSLEFRIKTYDDELNKLGYKPEDQRVL